MAELLRRAFSSEIEVRSAGDGRTVRGYSVPFDTPTTIHDWFEDYDEEFARGAFAKTIAERADKVKFLYQHDSAQPLGRAVELREDGPGLYSEYRVSKTDLGDQVLELVRDGVLDSFSIGFNPINQTVTDRGAHVVRTEVRLRETSIVTFPAYEDAVVTGIRQADRAELAHAVEFANTWRSGGVLSAQNAATLKHVLSLVSAADRAVDEAQPILAALLGVPNPDIAQDAQDAGNAEAATAATPRAGLPVELARRKAQLAGLRF